MSHEIVYEDAPSKNGATSKPGQAEAASKSTDFTDYEETAYGYTDEIEGVDKIKEFVSFAKEGKAELTYIVTRKGIKESVKFNGEDVKKFLQINSFEGRLGLVESRIRERYAAIAKEALGKLNQHGQLKKLNSLEEAALWETGVVREHKRQKGAVVIRESNIRKYLREDYFGGDNDYQFPMMGSSQNPYFPERLRFGPANIQMTLNDRWDMLAKAYYAWHHDPVAKQGIQIITYYVLGRGLEIICDDDAVDKVVKQFWKDNDMDATLERWCTDLSRDGNLFIRRVRPGDGTMQFRYLEPSTIWEIIQDAEDYSDIFFYHQQYQTRTQMYTDGLQAAAPRYVARDIPANEIIHVPVNNASAEVFGRSDLFPVLGYLKRLRDYVTAEIMKAQSAAQIQWDYTIKGGLPDVQRIQNTLSPPAPGTMGNAIYHNDAVTVQALNASKSDAAGNGSVYEGLINLIAVGLGIAKDYLGITSRGSRATALVATEPAAKRFISRQQVINRLVTQIVEDVIAEAQARGRIARTKKKLGFKVVFPQIVSEDRQLILNLLAQGQAMGWWSKEYAAEQAATEMELPSYAYDDQKAQIAKELADKDAFIWRNYQVVPFNPEQAAKMQAAARPSLQGPDGNRGNNKPDGEPSPVQTATSDSGGAQIKDELGPQNQTSDVNV